MRWTDDLEARFTRQREYEEDFLLLGGKALALRNQIPHAHLSGLPLDAARAFHREDPELHLGGRVWSEQAMDQVARISFIGANRRARAALEDALTDAQSAARGRGERPCLAIRGAELALVSIEAIDGKLGIAQEARRLNGGHRFVLAEEASLERCLPLLE